MARPRLRSVSRWIPARWSLAFLSFFGFMWLYSLRFGISQALVAMTGSASGEDNKIMPAEFQWTKEEQGLIQSSFFYGYTAISMPGGWLAGRFGGKRVITVAMLTNGILSLLTPLAAVSGVDTLVTLRVLQGLAQGPVYPAMHRIWGRWAPQAEVGPLTAVCYSGSYMGNLFSYIVGAWLSVHGFGSHPGQTYRGANWPSVFYVFGMGSLAWTFVWMWFAHETPAEHPTISEAELNFIQENVKSSESDKPYALLDVLPVVAFAPARIRRQCRVPWRAILRSVPVWSVCVSFFTFDFGLYFLMTNAPTYLKEVHKRSVFDTGIFSAVPYFFMWLVSTVAGQILNLACTKDRFSFTAQRKFVTGTGSLVPSLFLVLLGQTASMSAAIAFLTIAIGVSGLQLLGSTINQLDLAPQYADVLMGFTNFWGSAGGIVAPYVAATMTHDRSAAEWRHVFYLTASVMTFGALFFIMFGTAQQQSWAGGPPSSPTSYTRGKQTVENVGLLEESDGEVVTHV